MFDASKTKVRRALKFIEKLEAELAAHVASGMVRVRYDDRGNLIADISGLEDYPGAVVRDERGCLRGFIAHAPEGGPGGGGCLG